MGTISVAGLTFTVLWDGNDPSAATFEDATIPGAPRDHDHAV